MEDSHGQRRRLPVTHNGPGERVLRVGAAVAMVALTGSGRSPTPAIVFDSDRDGRTEIYAVSPGGSGLRQLTRSEPGIFSRLPDWSPDCREIAFQSNRDDPSNRDIYLMSTEGSDIRRLTSDPANDESPAWSPDGRSVAFASERGQVEAVYVADVDGSNLRRITHGPRPAFQPAWSPDGDRIAFISGTEANWDVFSIRADGSDLRQITHTPDRHEGGVVWSPSGTRILFDGLADGHWEIYVMDADGSNERQLTDNDSMDARPSWSPDGQQIVFHSTRDFGSDGDVESWHEVEIYVMRTDGTHTRRLTVNEHFDAHPDWCARR